jgi:hypothetical protein
LDFCKIVDAGIPLQVSYVSSVAASSWRMVACLLNAVLRMRSIWSWTNHNKKKGDDSSKKKRLIMNSSRRMRKKRMKNMVMKT